MECICINIDGVENVINVVIDNLVSKVIVLLIDKVVNFVNLYGVIKFVFDKLFVVVNNMVGVGRFWFFVVRYGNVVGFRGLVVLFFNKFIEKGIDYILVMYKDMMWFWIIF